MPSPRLVVTERAAFESFPGLDVLDVDELTRDASRQPATDVRRAHRRRFAGGARLHLGDDRALEGRHPLSQQLPRQHGEPPRLLAHHLGGSLPRRAAAVSRARPRQRVDAWLASGCRMRLVERFDIRRAAELFAAFSPTLFFGVPTIYVRLLELPPETSASIGAHMRLFVSGSAPLPATVFDAFRERFGHTILERYGMSETLMNISNPYVGERRPGTVGLPLPGVSTRIVTPELADVEAGRDWRAARARAERLLRLLGPARRHRGGVRRRLVPHRRSRGALRRRLLHAARAAHRSDHLRRLQHLSARDRGAAQQRSRDSRSRRRRRSGLAPRRECRSPTSSPTEPSTGRLSSSCAAARSRRSRCRARSSGSTRCRARRSARCRSTCCRRGGVKTCNVPRATCHVQRATCPDVRRGTCRAARCTWHVARCT